MRILSDISEFPGNWEKTIVTLGDFDGIHKGHQKLIYRAVDAGKEKGLPVVLMTYDPSPKKILKKLKFDNVIYTKQEKIILLQKYPLDLVYFFPFEVNTLELSADNFLRDIILDQLKADTVIIGYDHHFGKNREGNYEFLRNKSGELSFQVERVEEYYESDIRYSSSLVRESLKNGNVEKANELLGHAFFIASTVIRGYQRGTIMNIKTANLHIPPDKMIPGDGVYFGVVRYGGEILKCLINIGKNPTFGNDARSLEVHILNFNRNIYGESVVVYFLERIRDEISFKSMDALKEQILKDMENARNRNVENYLII